MKELSSLSNPFKAFSRSLITSSQAFILVSLACFFTSSCSSTGNKPKNLEVLHTISPTKSAEDNRQIDQEVWLPPLSGLKSTSDTAILVEEKSCQSDYLYLKSKFSVGSKTTIVKAKYPWDGVGKIEFRLDDALIRLPGVSLDEDLKDIVCNGQFDDDRFSLSYDSVLGKIGTLLTSNLRMIATDCSQIEFSTEGMKCNLISLMPQSAIVHIEDFQQGMIKRWSRQPYVLARRAGIAMTLAKAASNISNQVNLRKFCKVLSFSLPEELPLVMTSSNWKKDLCDSEAKITREAAFYGLSKAVEEMAIIQQLYESSSKVGLFSIKIPSSELPGEVRPNLQPFRVTITPNPEITDRILEIADSVLGRQLQIGKGTSRRRTASIVTNPFESSFLDQKKPSCWHPYFGESAQLMRIAEGIRLSGRASNGECDSPMQHDATESLAKYLMQSLTSETEFVMDNGQTKLLRLPEGEYKYIVELLPQNPVDAEETSVDGGLSTEGKLLWGSSRSHSIRVWN